MNMLHYKEPKIFFILYTHFNPCIESSVKDRKSMGSEDVAPEIFSCLIYFYINDYRVIDYCLFSNKDLSVSTKVKDITD